jgi:hypothetical protein
MTATSGEGLRDAWCKSLPDRSMASLRAAAESLSAGQLRPHGYDYCYLNLLTIFRDRYSPRQLSSIAVCCLRNYLFSGEEFHAYCLAARGRRPWNAEMEALNTAIHLTAHARSTLKDLLSEGSVIVCGFHWGAYRFIPVGLGALGFPVTSVLTTAASDKYVSYSSFTGAEMTEARARGVSEAFYRAKVVDTHRRPELLSCIKSAKRAPGCLFFPVDGMFAPGPSSRSVEISFAGYPLRVRANPASLAAGLQIPLVVVFASREDPGRITIDVADVIKPGSGPAFVREATQRMYAPLEEHVKTWPEQWEGARTFHHLRKVAPVPRVAPSSEDLAAVRAGIEREQLSLKESRVVCMQMPDGSRSWVDCLTLRCFGRTPETRKMLAAIQERANVASLWQELRGDQERSRSLLQILGQLRAEGLLTVGI